MNLKKELTKGSSALLVLSVLKKKDMYGYQIIKEIELSSEKVFSFKEGTLYPILTRMKNAGYLTYRWEESPQGPPRKYYTLTEDGREYLRSLDEAWDKLVEQINAIRGK